MNTLHFSLDEMEVDSRPETVGIYWNNILTSQSRRTGVCVCMCVFLGPCLACEEDGKVRWHSLEFLSTSIDTLALAHFFIFLFTHLFCSVSAIKFKPVCKVPQHDIF